MISHKVNNYCPFSQMFREKAEVRRFGRERFAEKMVGFMMSFCFWQMKPKGFKWMRRLDLAQGRNQRQQKTEDLFEII